MADEPASQDAGSEVGTYVNANTFFKGVIKSDRSLGIDGRFEGEIQSEAEVVIGRDAEVKGNIKADTVIVSGKVLGNITCSVLEIQATGRIVGNVTPAQMLVSLGGSFRGQCFMGPEEGAEKPAAEQQSAKSKRASAGGGDSPAGEP